jgi:hypothetical protein
VGQQEAQPNIGWALMLDGRGARIRTGGLVDPNDARYRAALHPDVSTLLPNCTCHIVNLGDPNDARYRAALHPAVSTKSSNFTYRIIKLGDPNDARYRAALHPEKSTATPNAGSRRRLVARGNLSR